MENILARSSEKVIDANDFVSIVKKSLAKMGSYEARATGDEYAFCQFKAPNFEKSQVNMRRWTNVRHN